MKVNIKRFAAAVLSSAMIAGSFTVCAFANDDVDISNAAITAYDTSIQAKANGWNETAYIEWLPVSGAAKYEVYVKKAGGSYTQIDDELIRQYPTYWRADAVGLAAGSYQLKVSALNSAGAEIASCESDDIDVKAYDRSGVTFSSASYEKGTGLGAYKADGTLKDNAVVLYITDENKNTITCDIVTDSKGNKTTGTGLGEIINLFQKGYESRPFAIRFIGELAPPYSTTKFTLDVTDEEFHAGNNASYRILDVKYNMKNISSGGITFEGIGNDTILHFNFNLVGAKSIEVRNLAFKDMTTKDEDGVTITSSTTNWWVHNCDFFYGGQGSDNDQAKGDGSVDFKGTPDYGTVSYNHFWDTGKSTLGGLGESNDYNISYHHNWFDHSDSRHPRTRNGSYHIYNNYYDGNAKYGVGVTSGCSAFVESNYFRNVNDVMLISQQGTDALGSGTFGSDTGGIIKVYNNIMAGNYKYIEGAIRDENGTIIDYNQNADGYSVDNRSDTLPSSLTSLVGGTSYNNFDTTRDINVKESDIDPVEDVPSIVMAEAGRCDTGSFKFEFDDAVDDTDYSVNTKLKAALEAYHNNIVSIGGTVTGSVSSSAAPSSATGIDGNTTYQDTAAEREAEASNLPSESTAPQSGSVSGGISSTNYAIRVLAGDLSSATLSSSTVVNGTIGSVTVLASSDKTVTLSSSKGIQLGGAGDGAVDETADKIPTYRAIKFTVAEDGKVYVTGSSTSSDTRTIAIADSTGKLIGTISTGTEGAVDLPAAGDYYAYSTNKGINITQFAVVYNSGMGNEFDDEVDDDDDDDTSEASSETPTETTTEETTQSIPVDIDNGNANTNSDTDGINVTYDAATDTWTLTDTSSTATAELTVPFEPVSKGKYLVTATVTPNLTASKWAFFQLRGTRADGTVGEVLGIAGDTNKNLAVRTYASGATEVTYSADNFGTLTGKDYNVSILIDFDNQTADVTIDGLTKTVTNINAGELDSYYAMTATGATDRTVKIKGFTISKIIDFSGYMRGDIDGDGKITATDAAYLFKMAAGAYTPSIDEDHISYVTDVDGVSGVTFSDADEVLKKALDNSYVLPAAKG